MNYPIMTFEDLKNTHLKQIYNNPPDTETDDSMEFDLLSKYSDISNIFTNIGNYDFSIESLLETYEDTSSLYKKISIDEEEQIIKIKEFFKEIKQLNSGTYVNKAIRHILL